MVTLISIWILVIQAGMLEDYPLMNGKPTSKGIELYVEQNSESLVREFQEFIGDTLYNVWIYTDELKEQAGTEYFELGRFFPHEIYITTAELYEAYELDDLSPEQRGGLKECNKFVKAVIIHELTHEYVNQIGVEMQSVYHIHVDKSYQTGIWIVNSHETFGSSFIEEGISEYLTGEMGELIPPPHVEIPVTMDDLFDRDKEYTVKYKYASAFLKSFLDTTGFKKGVQILLHNPPPSYEEILQPDLFFGRLEAPIRR
ncbi:MAG: hypothetical protein R6W31_11265 [Bacteroidales bacterium]